MEWSIARISPGTQTNLLLIQLKESVLDISILGGKKIFLTIATGATIQTVIIGFGKAAALNSLRK